MALLAVFVLVLGTTACGTVVQTTLGMGEFRAAQYLPADSYFFTSTTFRPTVGQMASVKVLQDAFTSQPGFADAWAEVRRASGSATSVDFEQDVLPLLDGEIAFAAAGSPLSEPRFVNLVHATDPEKLMKLPFGGGATDPVLEKGYKDASFIAKPSGARTGWVVAAYKGWVIASNSRALVEQTIDRIDNASGGLAQNPRFASAVEKLPAERLSYAYFDVTSSLLERLGTELSGAASQQAFERARGRTAVATIATPAGLEVRSEWIPDQPRAIDTSLPRGDTFSAFNQLPSSTLVALAGSDFPHVAREGLESLKVLAEQTSDDPSQQAAFDFADQAIELFGGDYAVGFGPGLLRMAGRTRGATADVHGIALLSDPMAMVSALEGIESLGSVTERSEVWRIAEGEESAWVLHSEDGDTTITYGLDGQYLFAASGEPEQVYAARSSRGFDGNSRFGLVKSMIPSDGTGFFMDLQSMRTTLEEMASPADRKIYDPIIKPIITPIRAFGGGWQVDPETSAMSGRMLLAITR